MAYQLTSLGISVLALLREHPMHGYEMCQTPMSRREDRIVKVRPGSLYHVVSRLAQEKLIRQTATGRAGNRPERTTFEITDAGVAEMLTLRDARAAAPIHLIAFDYLVATTQAKVDWLRQLVMSLESGRLAWPRAGAPDILGLAQSGVGV